MGDTWACDIEPLELQNAETKRVADRSGSRRVVTSTASTVLVNPPPGTEGPDRAVKTRAYSTTVALSTLKHLLATKYLRQGDGIQSIPLTRRTERLFGKTGSGRTKSLSSGLKHEKLGVDYDPREDSCIKAFVRLMAESASKDL